MIRIILTLVFISVCYFWGNWRNWKEYYPTILYWIIGDLSYNYIFYDNYLWHFEKLINHTFSNFLVAFIIFPCQIILFFTYFPTTFWKRSGYILLWTLGDTFIEFFMFKMDYLSYNNNWNIFWSCGLYFFAFVLIALHRKHPFITWLISGGAALLTMYLFNVPISALH